MEKKKIMIDDFGHPLAGPAAAVEPPAIGEDDSGLVWVRSDRIEAAMKQALKVAIRTHVKILGNDVKSVCWDVREEFEKAMRQ